MPSNNRRRFLGPLMVPIFLAGLAAHAAAQSTSPPVRTFTLEEAVSFALQNYPAVRAALERQAAAQAGVGLAQTSYLPRAELLWQSNRATANNIFGQLLPNPVIPGMSGPVLPFTSGGSVWGSAGGLLLSWVPWDFGYRHATVEAARASEDRSASEAAITRLDVAVTATNGCLSLLAAEEAARTAQADVERRQALARSTHVLVQNELRPGADAARADAELAAARIGLARARQQVETVRAALAQALGIAGTPVEVNPGPLLSVPPEENPAAPPLASNPFAAAQQARVREQEAQVRVFERANYPVFDFQSAVFGRGSGANPNGTLASGWNGLGLERGNWAAGITVSFSLTDLLTNRAQKRIASAHQRAEAARYQQTLQDLTGQVRQAEEGLAGARQVALETPIELASAKMAETQARARYQASLGTIVEVAEAQSLLVQAETGDALARLAVWQNLAALAAAQGDLEPFLNLVRRQASGGH